MRALLVATAAVLALSCNARANGERGGEPERQLAVATVAGDVEKVRQLLSADADPNKMAAYEGHFQSPWKLALHQVRPGRRDLIDIVLAMLHAHARPDVAFGEGPSRRGGYSVRPTTPILEAVSNDVPDVARALFDAGLDPRLGQVALVLSIENHQAAMAYQLVEAGVDVNCHPSANTPLVAAIEARDEALMTYLEAHGAREKP